MMKFEVETIAADKLPSRTGGTGTPKYDWGSIPKPAKGQANKVTVTGIKSPKTLYTSIKRYKAALEGKGTKPEDMPEFTLSTNKDAKGEVQSISVYRTA